MKILVIQQKMIGDVLTSTIICEALRKVYPNATIDFLVNSNTRPVIAENPFFDNIIEFKNEYKSSKKEFFFFLKQIRQYKYDHVIDVYGKLESNLITLFSGASTKVSFYKWYTQFLYTKTIKRNSQSITNASIAIENRLRLVFPEDRITSEITKPKIFLTKEEKEKAKDFLESNNISTNTPLIMISVLGSEIKKTLPFEYMAKVIDTIVKDTGACILFNYIPDQENDARTIYNLTNYKTQKHIHLDVFAKSLRGFLAILSHCTALVGNEGGAINMGKALGVPTFTIFSPWILKKDWNMFDDGETHISVHLSDYFPELFLQKNSKELKNESLDLYPLLKPELFINQLLIFLSKNL
ncbi:glycosyltransferase family 9 protein [Aquimarina muelleri]|uniref:Heptosyltransferase n=1 Tax=Aquimarina muelleri TaxID=279356 RepID=A0A918N3A3_9FLAO|nr:glycosyltransferase family 9 protein [Aquimarina muelleri]MCX2761261.1 glycosyltransferase family 9 protein [Aquimarina muelleri]GGX09460.1 heptosyltransferase [Aquimarina muelleri]